MKSTVSNNTTHTKTNKYKLNQIMKKIKPDILHNWLHCAIITLLELLFMSLALI